MNEAEVTREIALSKEITGKLRHAAREAEIELPDGSPTDRINWIYRRYSPFDPATLDLLARVGLAVVMMSASQLDAWLAACPTRDGFWGGDRMTATEKQQAVRDYFADQIREELALAASYDPDGNWIDAELKAAIHSRLKAPVPLHLFEDLRRNITKAGDRLYDHSTFNLADEIEAIEITLRMTLPPEERATAAAAANGEEEDEEVGA